MFARRIIFVQNTSRTSQSEFDATRNILVTGGLGRLGKSVCSNLIRAGYFVIVLDASSDTEQFFDELTYNAVDHEQVKIFIGNIQNHSIIHAIRAQYKRILGIIHLAGTDREAECQEFKEACFRNNVESTQRFLEAFQLTFGDNKKDRPWLIYFSSFSICARQLNSYLAESKVIVERVIRTFSHLFSSIIILRSAEVYGLFDDSSARIIPYFTRQAMTDSPISLTEPTFVRYFIHVTDAMRVLLELIRMTTATSQYYQTSSISTYCLCASSVDQKSLLSIVLKMTSSHALVRTMKGTQSLESKRLCTDGAISPNFAHLFQYKRIAKGLWQYIGDIKRRDLRFAQDLLRNECLKNLVEASDFNNCTMLIYTNSNKHSMITCRNETPWHTTSKFFPDFRFVSTNVKNVRGMSGYYIQCHSVGSSFLCVVNQTVTKSADKSLFFFSYMPENRSVALLTYIEEKTDELFSVQLNGSLKQWDGFQHLYCLSPYCCEGRTDLPLLQADHLLQKQRELSWHDGIKNSSTKCHRLKMFIDQEITASGNRTSWKQVLYSPLVKDSLPVDADRPLCDRNCSLFTGCILFDNCRCVADRCSRKHRNTRELVSQYKFKSIDQINFAQLPFETVLQHRSKPFYHYLNLPRIHVLDVPSTLVPYYNDSNRDHLHKKHCFNVDDIILRGLINISTSISSAELVVVPFFHGFYVHYKSMYYWRQIYLIQQLKALVNDTLAAVNSTAKTVFVLSHDSGGCIGFAWDHLELLLSSYNYQPSALFDSYLLQPNGDYNTHCYYPHKDIVIPPFTCLTRDLLNAFRDLHHIKPILHRRVFAFFKGTIWGNGLTTRARLSCPNLWKHTWNQTTHGITLIQSYYNNSDYLTTLNETRFCLIVPGTVGWSPRFVDVIYAGCIPVLISSNTRYPFEDILDYTTFSIHVSEERLDTLEEELLSYNANELLARQRNVLKVRTAFLFENYRNPAEHLYDKNDPLFFMLLSLRLRLNLKMIQ
ncbi:unnamed protein product [Adineta ricciae]|uniref:Exostosin GT47 domain-containing protein n=1 Tax=Adineta ricciae TaxID=249248 RepID=A0A815VD94_ADIRI|nr:unnamed protein product [Adineta ricciae]CAF1534156.1 unnamed protein product [Adineta ricciae]